MHTGHAGFQPAGPASRLGLQGSPATKAPPAKSQGTGQENKSAWALEVALDVETAHSMTPGANVVLVTTPTAGTLGVQGFPQMMAAGQYDADPHLAQAVSQSFASAEDAFGSAKSLQSLRHAFISAAQKGVTVLGSSGDGGTAHGGTAHGGTANGGKASVGGPNAGKPFPVPDCCVAGVGPAGHGRWRNVPVHGSERGHHPRCGQCKPAGQVPGQPRCCRRGVDVPRWRVQPHFCPSRLSGDTAAREHPHRCHARCS